MKEEYKEATSIGSVTLVGFSGSKSFPKKWGNCFSVGTNNKEWYKIVNFNYENFEHLLKQKVISFPVKILELGKNSAVICDNRIPRDYYNERFCIVCTPTDLLPIPQRLEQLLDLQDGTRKEFGNGIVQITYQNKEVLKLKEKWKVEVEPDEIAYQGLLDKEEEIAKK